MAEKTETKTENPKKSEIFKATKSKKKDDLVRIEREYTIPLRKKWVKVPRYKRANKAIRAIKEFLVRHMKIRDRDLRKIKVDKYLNEVVWFRGIKNPPSKIKVKAIKEGDIVRAELSEMPEKLKFKKARLEKREQKAAQIPAKKPAEKPVEKLEPEKEQIQKEKKEEEKEKKAAVVETGEEMEKAAAKQMKKMKSQKIREPKHHQRKALAK